jgi:hypothetical protein
MTLPVAAPETRGADAAREVAAEHLPDWLRLHSERSYQFAAAHARDRAIDHDAELLFVAAMVHDLCLVSGFDEATLPFEEAGGLVAQVLATGLGWPPARRQHLERVIVLHMGDDVAPEVDAESYLLQVGTSADVSGGTVELFDADVRRGIVAAFPRDGFPEQFLAAFEAQAARKPSCAAASAMATGGWPDRVRANPLGR